MTERQDADINPKAPEDVMERVNIHVRGFKDISSMDNKTFQVHVKDDRLVLYEVKLPKPDTRCPVIIHGERCGEKAGHEGKHCWGGGD